MRGKETTWSLDYQSPKHSVELSWPKLVKSWTRYSITPEVEEALGGLRGLRRNVIQKHQP